MVSRLAAAEAIVTTYLDRVRTIRAGGLATAEQSYYPAVRDLLGGLGALLEPALDALPHPAGRDGDFPDVALYDTSANVLVLPVEVKPARDELGALGSSGQAQRYARSFGGGRVLVTNLWSFGYADSAGTLQTPTVRLANDETALDSGPTATQLAASADLLVLISEATTAVGSLVEPRDVAWHLAWHAGHMRDAINGTGRPEALLARINAAFADSLGIEIAPDLLVSTIVQTIVYGLYAAWLDTEDPQDFDWRNAAYRLDVPVFAEILHEALSPHLVRSLDLRPHLEATARVLERIDRPAFASRYDAGAIEYFYEPFLAAFDTDLRDQLGVWYTPREIAEYQVARTDHHLTQDLGLVDGVADQSVVVLDPAAGTGTYIAATLRLIHQRLLEQNVPAGIAAARTREAATERVVGFEILPAAFVISHLHISRLLAQMGAPLGEGDRLRIYLTNSLTDWGEQPHELGETLFPDLVGEVEAARRVKRSDLVLAVLGNPPYWGYSSAESQEEQDMIRQWIEPLWPVWGIRKHRLNDLYIRFWRVAMERIATLTGRGVVSFISNRKWLTGRSYPAMRCEILASFDSLVVDDLHGGYTSSDSAGGADESIFSTHAAPGIRVGTAIVTAVRRSDSAEGPASVMARDLYSTAESKRERLAALTIGAIDTGLAERAVSADAWWRLAGGGDEEHASLDEYFDYRVSGVQTIRDEAVVDRDRDRLESRMRDYFDPAIPWADLVARYPAFDVSRERYNGERVRRRLVDSSTFHPERIVRYLFKPFDARWLYWEPKHKLLNEARVALMPYYLSVPGQWAMVVPQIRNRPGAARPSFATQVPSYKAAFEDARVFPLWKPSGQIGLTPGELGGPQTGTEQPNVMAPWIEAARAAGTPGGDRALAETIFFGLAGIAASPLWLASQPVEGDDFPTMPLPADPEALAHAASVGRKVAHICDPDQPIDGVTTGVIDPRYARLAVPDATGPGRLEHGRVGNDGGRRSGLDVYWDADHAWRGVPDELWDFSVSGFRPLSKWLSYWVGETLTARDREQFTLLARRIAAALDLGADADAAYVAAAAAPLETAPDA